MAILKIARMGHPVLLQKCEPVADPGAPEIRRLVADMLETMEDAFGAGLAAPQVHVPLRLFVFRVSEARGNEDAGDTPVRQHRGDQPGDRTAERGACASLGGLPVDPRPARRGAPRATHPLSRRRLRRQAGRARGDRIPCRRGAARIRPPGRHPVSDADARFLAVRLHRGNGAGRRGAAGRTLMAVERSAERDAAIAAMLPHVPFDGWTRRALRAGLADIGMAREDAEQLFPGGAADMIEAFCDLADRRMEEGAAALDPAMRLHQRVRAVIALRLEQNRPHKEAIRRALALLALPGHVAAGCGMHRAHGGRDLACRGRSFGGFQLVHQAGDPRRGVWRHAAVLAARFQ